jgi:hypothetical protein
MNSLTVEKISRSSIVVAIALTVSACAIPTIQSPYYHPNYPELVGPEGGGAWLPSSGKSGAPPYRIRIGHSATHFMELSVTADEENFVLAWRFNCGVQRCNTQVENRPILVEDLDSGKQVPVETVRRIFLGTARPQVDLMKDLAVSIPAFAEVNADQRRYTISIPLRHEFDGPLPERVSIQLPPITVGEQSIPLPPLVLLKQETGKNIRAYAPASYQALSRTTAFTNFAGASTATLTSGSFGFFTPATYSWFERKGEIMLSASFMGRDDIQPKLWEKPFIAGEVKVLIMSGSIFKLEGNSVTWLQTPDEMQAVQVPIRTDRHSGNLSMYTTKPHDRTTLLFPDGTVIGEQLWLAVMPKLHPKKVRITFPEVALEGKPLLLKPIEFEYRLGGIGMAVWP